ncbi:MAG TPA: hypothetical protein VF026_32310 [Ktedonobacteraceae bacterium]
MSKQYGWEWISGLITSGWDNDRGKPLDLPDEGANLVWEIVIAQAASSTEKQRE